MSGLPPGSVRSAFIERWVGVAAGALGLPGRPCRALDLAMGEGRHALLLAEAGFTTFGVDVSPDRVRTACERSRLAGLSLHAWVADLDTWPLPPERFDLLVVSRFLVRARWEDLRNLVRPGGFVVYETFTTGQLARGIGPSSPDHLLNPGELGQAFDGWEILSVEEVSEPAAIARLAARKRTS